MVALCSWIRDLLLRAPSGVEKVPRLLCPGREARVAAELRNHPPSLVSRKCHACYALSERRA
eukprot:3859652-Pyramimonas_sp.AAC.1